MPQLIAPDVRFRASFLDAMKEFQTADEYAGVTLTRELAVYGDTFLGRIHLRHRLTPQLRETGGHIGYGVRPGARRQGHATAMLRACLPYARELGIESVLLTCDRDNAGSRRAIEANGGVFENEREGNLRFWIRTAG
ncbi:GNAT family N-acetyltransferase [Streptomyces sp. NPDC002994]|uniref:GNAT family N-acetyltransferase n=1 Tax=Streptomyces sp. NPDC002994 TaxID=3154441 RepID=UPI0033B0BCBD